MMYLRLISLAIVAELFLLVLPLKYDTKNVVIITGGTGVLGRSLVNECVNNYNCHTLFSYRNQNKLENFNQLINSKVETEPFYLDLYKLTSSQILKVSSLLHNEPTNCMNTDSNLHETIMNNCFEKNSISHLQHICQDASNLVIINNAAICLEGNNKEIFIKILFVNCIFPYLFTTKMSTVINICSGDGELVCIHSSIQDSIQNIKNQKVLCIASLVID